MHLQREHLSAPLGGKLYAISGQWGQGGQLNSVEVHDPAANVWSISTPIKEARGGASPTVPQGQHRGG